MKKLIAIILIVFVINTLTAYKKRLKHITLESTEILNNKLQQKEFGHFNEKTGLSKALGGRTMYPEGVDLAIEFALDDYRKYLHDSSSYTQDQSQRDALALVAELTASRKQELLKLLLNDSVA